MKFATAYDLDPAHREALAHSLIELIDMVHSDLVSLARDRALTVAETEIGQWLPERYLPGYTPDFLRRFLVALTALGQRLAEPMRFAAHPAMWP